MLKRKIENFLLEWKHLPTRKPLVIKGIRQCGKTYIVQKFAHENYDHVVLELKSKSGNTKNLATVMKNKSVYHINHAIKLGVYNVGRNGNLLTIPLYMGFLIQDSLADIVIPDIEW